jgi:hypothetical protein
MTGFMGAEDPEASPNHPSSKERSMRIPGRLRITDVGGRINLCTLFLVRYL